MTTALRHHSSATVCLRAVRRHLSAWWEPTREDRFDVLRALGDVFGAPLVTMCTEDDRLLDAFAHSALDEVLRALVAALPTDNSADDLPGARGALVQRLVLFNEHPEKTGQDVLRLVDEAVAIVQRAHPAQHQSPVLFAEL